MPLPDQIDDSAEPLTADERDILDVGDGVDRMLGDRTMYARLLARFRADYGLGAGPVRAALAAGDRLLAQRTLHTMKGAAGMIGAHRLHRRAAALESALGSPLEPSERSLDLFAGALAELLETLDQLLPPAEPADAPGAEGRGGEPDPQLVARLAQLLSDGDGAALDLIEESGASLKASLGEARWEAVSAAAHQFDFEGALAAIGDSAGGATAGR